MSAFEFDMLGLELQQWQVPVLAGGNTKQAPENREAREQGRVRPEEPRVKKHKAVLAGGSVVRVPACRSKGPGFD